MRTFGAARWLPRTIAARLSLILFGGLLIAHGLSFSLLFYERYEAARSMLMSNVEQDVVVAVNMLDRLLPAERAEMLPLLRRRTFYYRLDAGEGGPPLADPNGRDVAQRIGMSLGPHYPLTTNAVRGDPGRFEIHAILRDGTAVTVDVRPSVMPIARWLPYVLAAQLALLLLCTLAAVRLATRPLERLANAAQSLRPTGDGERLKPGGPKEVANAVDAFNAMQDRIARYMRERLHILASISHDLQTPITRMSLRVESMEGAPERDKLLDDLGQMQHLVREGIAYARSAHGGEEPLVRLDMDAFLESLVADYRDIGKPVSFAGRSGAQANTRLHALRRIVANLIDNALKYAGEAEVLVEIGATRQVLITVRDHGPGIPDNELANVLEPFYRLEASRNRDTGGTGLGLAIAQQLADAIGAALSLRNRDGGGLDAVVQLPADAR
ncbi:HAMP domain-containing sensor histidine kinase [Lysobacter solisilvae (ex Woo and Kim 2020)]|uniref:histidine kinase n=1 Tax=Agrilutibacter terrestris TaxID=2865112 RepID=A0A7H0FXK6_9GAMM|nr:HAMP domain-containing sensor histidine kinase [Lysobacter terrestris]QNP40772.1 HAMP domain-containing histidine kinase [Lysobacter terrestris]